MHGCYVDTHATYPVGTTLDLTLDANGIRLQTKGVVRVNYPYLGMGIALKKLSKQNQDRLREILRIASQRLSFDGPAMPPLASAASPLDAVRAISDTSAAIRELINFFQENPVLTREGFIRILWMSNSGPAPSAD